MPCGTGFCGVGFSLLVIHASEHRGLQVNNKRLGSLAMLCRRLT